MIEIVELNTRLLDSAGKELPQNGIHISRNELPNEIASIPKAISREIARIVKQLKTAIPNDFDFSLWLGVPSPDFRLTYSDGFQTEAFGPSLWNLDSSIFDQLRSVDWDDARRTAVTNCQVFDLLREEAENQETRMPATQKAQDAFRDQVTAFMSKKTVPSTAVEVLVWNEGFGLQEENFDNIEDLKQQLPDMLTCQYRPVAVVVSGKPLPVEDIDRLNIDAYEDLRGMPLSQGKAACKFGERPFWDQ